MRFRRHGARSPLPNGNVRLIRNHENRDDVDDREVKGDPKAAYDPKGGGGTTSLEVRVGSRTARSSWCATSSA